MENEIIYYIKPKKYDNSQAIYSHYYTRLLSKKYGDMNVYEIIGSKFGNKNCSMVICENEIEEVKPIYPDKKGRYNGMTLYEIGMF